MAKNDAFFQVAVKREEAISREISKKIAEDKKMNKKEKDERLSNYSHILFWLTHSLLYLQSFVEEK